MKKKPMVQMSTTVKKVMIMPVFKKSMTDRYGCCQSSNMSRELTLGKEENGNPIAALTANAAPIAITSGAPTVAPMVMMTGMRMMEATV